MRRWSRRGPPAPAGQRDGVVLERSSVIEDPLLGGLQRRPRHRVTMYEERPPWDGVGKWTRRSIARFRFNRSRSEWQLYWMRQDLRWQLYDPDEMPADLASLVAMVEADKYGAFFG